MSKKLKHFWDHFVKFVALGLLLFLLLPFVFHSLHLLRDNTIRKTGERTMAIVDRVEDHTYSRMRTASEYQYQSVYYSFLDVGKHSGKASYMKSQFKPGDQVAIRYSVLGSAVEDTKLISNVIYRTLFDQFVLFLMPFIAAAVVGLQYWKKQKN